MELTIIIVNWNTKDLLRTCLESIEEFFFVSKSNEIEIFVVDNASSDSSLVMLSTKFPWVKLIKNKQNVGFAKANNQAIQVAQSRYLLLLNSDTLVTKSSLCHLVNFMRTNQDVGICGPILLNINGSFQAAQGKFPSLLSCWIQLLGIAPLVYGNYFPSAQPNQALFIQDVDWLGGACLLVRRKAIDDIGLLDEQFFMYAEEIDWCYRMHQHNWRVCLVPEAKIFHLGGGSSHSIQPYLLARQWQSIFLYYRKHKGLLATLLLRILITILGLIRTTIFGLGATILSSPKLGHKAIANLNLSFLKTR